VWGRHLACHPLLRELAQLATLLALALLVINLGYGFDGSFKALGDFQFQSRILRGESSDEQGLGNRFRDTPLAALPVPLPEQYVQGIDVQKHAVEQGRMAYLFGTWKFRGWWYYYLAAATVKVPVGIWVLLAIAIGIRVGQASSLPTKVAGTLRVPPARRIGVPPVPVRRASSLPASFRDEFLLLAPAIATLIFISSQTGINRHFRYALPIFPFLYVWLSSLALLYRSPHAPREESLSAKPSRLLHFLPALLVALAWLSAIGHSLWVYPHSLSYFNELAGGPRHGHRFLLGSNTDCGQDLILIRSWLDHHPEARPAFLAWESHHANPPMAGISASYPYSIGTPGWYLISVNLLQSPSQDFREFVNRRPHFIIGGSVAVFYTPTNEHIQEAIDE
jgi:hypothetical protein